MGHEQLHARPDPGVLQPMGQDITEYDRALCNLLMKGEFSWRTVRPLYRVYKCAVIQNLYLHETCPEFAASFPMSQSRSRDETLLVKVSYEDVIKMISRSSHLLHLVLNSFERTEMYNRPSSAESKSYTVRLDTGCPVICQVWGWKNVMSDSNRIRTKEDHESNQWGP